MYKFIAVVLLFAALFIVPRSICRANPGDAVPKQLSYSYAKKGYLYFEGNGIPNPESANQTQRRNMSNQAAIIDAMSKIAIYVDGLKLKNNEIVKDAKAKDPKLVMRIDSSVKGAETVKTSWDDGDNCRVMLRIIRKNVLKDLEAKER